MAATVGLVVNASGAPGAAVSTPLSDSLLLSQNPDCLQCFAMLRSRHLGGVG